MNRYYFLLLLIALLSWAQAENNADNETYEDDVKLKEVVVNATRTQTKLKRMPASVSVHSASSLALHEVHAMHHASVMIPNLYMPDYGSKLTSPVYIRGIGSRINAPSVGMYVDNIPYFEKAAFDFDFFDVQKIEVLRGPQGTLYGRNSMGGLINITTRSPFDYQGTHVLLSAANYGQYRLNTGHYQQASEKLAYSIALNYLHQDGFYTNTTLHEKVDRLTAYGVRFKVQYQMSDRWTFDVISNTDWSKQGGYPYALYDKTTQTDEVVNYNQPSGYDRLLISNALKLRYAAPKWEFSNHLSYQLLDDLQQIDQDFGPDSVYFAGQQQQQHNFANEMTLQSKEGGRFNWLFGLFAFNQGVRNVVDVDSYQTPTPAGNVHLWYQKNYLPVTTGVAVFHQSAVEVLPKLTLTAGIRVDYEQSEMQYRYNGVMGETALMPVDTVYPTLYDAVVLPKLALAYALQEDFNMYASYSTGYKPGGFNSTFERPEHLMFKKELSHNVEAGFKAELFKYIYTDVAFFYTQLMNQQIYHTAPSGRGSYLDNSGLSLNKGFELTLQNHVFHGFEGMITYGYTHAKIAEYELNDSVHYHNKFTPYVPAHTFAFQANQTIPFKQINALDRMQVSLMYTHTGLLYWNLSNTLSEPGYGLLNAKISFERGNYKLDFWGKNITNNRYHAFLFESGSRAFAQSGKPVQVGVNFTVNF